MARVVKRAVGAGLAIAGCAAAVLLRRNASFDFRGKVVVITGGSRGLGLVLARRLCAERARVALLARDPAELEEAASELGAAGCEVMTAVCDVGVEGDVRRAIDAVARRFGGVDIVINNAGTITVGPLAQMTPADFEQALRVHVFGPLHTTIAAVPHMRRAGGGRILNIASIGGKIAVPHLLPYTASKFALVGLSEGLRAELRRDNVFVTTVCPGLMRTGSPPNAQFKGQYPKEYAWFAIGDSLPVVSMSAERAARKMLAACRKGSPQLILGAPARVASLAHDLFPALTAALNALVSSLMPEPDARGGEARRGSESESRWAPSLLTELTERAADRNNERISSRA